MNKLEDDVLLKFLPDTLVKVRKEFGLDKPDVLKASLDELEQWVSEQKHFVKKDFSREDLERVLITCKGSVAKTKLRIDKSCTVKTLLPQYFDSLDARADIEPFDNLITFALLPRLTEDHERVLIIRTLNFTGCGDFFSLYRYLVKVLEYVKRKDYNSGLILLLDYTNANLKYLLPKLSITEMRQMANIVLDSYGLRLRKLLLLSSSKIIHTLIALIKPLVSGKIGMRVQVYKDYKKLYQHLPLAILPEEYEGPERCIDDLHDDLLRALTSENFVDCLKDMKSSKTNESLRNLSVFNESYLGAPGSLNKFIVD